MAAVDFFLKIDGIPGESKDSKLKDHIQVESWSWGESNTGSNAVGGGGGGGRVSMQDFHFTMLMNKASPKLMRACAAGDHIKEAKLICRKAGGEQLEYLHITLSDLLVSSYQTGGSSGSGVLPIDQVSLNFTKIKVEYKEQNETGKLGGGIVGGYDLKAGKAL